MDEALYNLMDWSGIESIIYSENDHPQTLLGAHITNEGILFQTFIPTAKQIVVRLTKTNKEYPMTCMEKSGFYAALVPGKKIVPYTYVITYDNDTTQEIVDPYAFDYLIDSSEMSRFTSGINYDIYEKLGAHVMEVNGVKGVLFAVWAPNALRASVVGNFNNWDGRRHPMKKFYSSGIYELFIPGLATGEIYKFELKTKSGLVTLKADPYANQAELRPHTASIVCDLNTYQWNDSEWLSNRAACQDRAKPLSIYEMHLGSWKRPSDKEFYNYRELAPMVANYVKSMGYTHIELLPIMEHPFDGSWGYQVTGYYAPTSRFGSPEDFMYFVDYMHQNGIGVILDWVPAHFPKDGFGLANFDGTCLFEHQDPKQGEHPHWGTLIFNYGRPEVSNFLIANALFWIKKYHTDGIRIDAVASMLYLDYGKNDGEWIPNMYGGNENLEAIELFKHLNSIFKKNHDGALLIAEESTAWPKITEKVEDGGLGFDYKWNMGWMNDFTDYMKCDPLFRKHRHGELTFSMIYAYSEKFILVFSHDEVVHGKCSMLNKMPGDMWQKFANLRLAYGFMMTHPGKKLLFMGQDFAQEKEWNEAEELQWDLLNQESHSKINTYMKDINKLYRNYPALYEIDSSWEGFEWISCMDADHSILVFVRKTANPEESLLVVCNFTPVTYQDFLIGVPFHGKYKEIFNSDNVLYGGAGNVNSRMKHSKEIGADGRAESINIVVPPLGISVITCVPINKEDKPKKTAAKKTTKKAESKEENK